MQSGKSFFNQTIFGKTVRRFWPLWLLYAGIWFFVLPMPLLGQLRWQLRPDAVECASNVLTFAIKGGTIISFIFSAFTAMAVFSHLYNSKGTGMFCVLPVRREGMFFSCFLAGLLPVLLINVLIALLALGVEALYHVADPATLCQWFVIVSMTNITFYGFASFCAMLTGQLLILPAVYGILSFTAVGLEATIRYILSCFVYGSPGSGSLRLSFLSPIWEMMSGMEVERIQQYSALYDGYITTGYYFGSWGMLAAYCVSGVVFAVLALLLYRSRRMESAGDTVAIRVLRPVFRWCLALACALALGCLMHVILIGYRGSNNSGTLPHMLVLLLFMLIGGVIGWFGANMLMKKTFRVFRSNLRGLAVFCVLLCALTLACEFDLFGYEKRMPKPDDVVSVAISYNGNNAEFTEPENIRGTLLLHESLIAHKTIYEHSDGSTGGAYTRLLYTLSDGRTFSRLYWMLYCSDPQWPEANDDLAAIEALLNSKEGLLSRKHVSIPVTEQNISTACIEYDYRPDDVYHPDDAADYPTIRLTSRAMYQLYNECILPDLEDGTLGRLYLTDEEAYSNEVYNLTIRFELYDLEAAKKREQEGIYDGSIWEDFFTHPTIYSTRTNAWLTEHGVRLETVAEAQAAIERINEEAGEPASPTDLRLDVPVAVPESDASRVIDVPAA